jgi:hypothetical protein
LVWITGSVAFAVFLVSLWKLRAELGLPGYNPEWAKETHIPIEVWQKKFKASKEKSLAALRDYYGTKDLGDLLKKIE